jgi:20S proteasome alpha/beta subunit
MYPKSALFYPPYGRITSEQKGRDDLMSIAIGLVGIDGVILATDSRMTIGTDTNLEYTDDNSQKLWKLTDNLGLTSVGSQQGFRQYLLEVCQRKLQESGFDNLNEDAIELLTHTVKTEFMHQLEGLGEAMARALLTTRFGMMIAGYNKSKPTILSMRGLITPHDIPFAKDIRRLYWIDSASGIAEHLLVKTKMIDRLRGGLSLDMLKRLAVLLVEETKISHSSVGGEIQMATVTKDSGFCFTDEDEIKNITEEADTCIGNQVESIAKWLDKT